MLEIRIQSELSFVSRTIVRSIRSRAHLFASNVSQMIFDTTLNLCRGVECSTESHWLDVPKTVAAVRRAIHIDADCCRNLSYYEVLPHLLL